MKKAPLILSVVILASLAFVAGAGLADEPADEKAAVVACVRDYIDGWYDGDVERMERALHPDLAKRSLRALPSGAQYVHTLSSNSMIEFTRAGFGKQNKQEGQVNEVIVLDLLSQTASAKSISHEYIDLIHLAKINDKWWIVNVLWEPAGK